MHKESILICSALSHEKFLLHAWRAAQILSSSLQYEKKILVPLQTQMSTHPLSEFFLRHTTGCLVKPSLIAFPQLCVEKNIDPDKGFFTIVLSLTGDNNWT